MWKPSPANVAESWLTVEIQRRTADRQGFAKMFPANEKSVAIKRILSHSPFAGHEWGLNNEKTWHNTELGTEIMGNRPSCINSFPARLLVTLLESNSTEATSFKLQLNLASWLQKSLPDLPWFREFTSFSMTLEVIFDWAAFICYDKLPACFQSSNKESLLKAQMASREIENQHLTTLVFQISMSGCWGNGLNWNSPVECPKVKILTSEK